MPKFKISTDFLRKKIRDRIQKKANLIRTQMMAMGDFSSGCGCCDPAICCNPCGDGICSVWAWDPGYFWRNILGSTDCVMNSECCQESTQPPGPANIGDIGTVFCDGSYEITPGDGCPGTICRVYSWDGSSWTLIVDNSATACEGYDPQCQICGEGIVGDPPPAGKTNANVLCGGRVIYN